MNAIKNISGLILEQHHFTGDVEIFHLKGGDFATAQLCWTRAGIIISRGSGPIEIHFESSKMPITIDQTAVLLFPAKSNFRIAGHGANTELVVISFDQSVIDQTGREYGIATQEFRKAFDGTHRFPKTLWLSEVHHRYFFERCMCHKHESKACAFLEQELIKECFYSKKEEGRKQGAVPFLFEPHSSLKRAIDFIEANLFKKIALDMIAKKAAVSRAGLVRLFQKEIGKAPFQYIKDRRMQEALNLLRVRSVAQTADMVGYQNVSAFSQAFRRMYHSTPTEWLARLKK